jgi:hypothetical protein
MQGRISPGLNNRDAVRVRGGGWRRDARRSLPGSPGERAVAEPRARESTSPGFRWVRPPRRLARLTSACRRPSAHSRRARPFPPSADMARDRGGVSGSGRWAAASWVFLRVYQREVVRHATLNNGVRFSGRRRSWRGGFTAAI